MNEVSPKYKLASNLVLSVATDLKLHGWSLVSYSGRDRLELPLNAIALTLGTPVPGRREQPPSIILEPTVENSAPSKSISKKYGLSAFPYHTDTAHWEQPARYICLACEDVGTTKTPTHLISMSHIDIDEQIQNHLQHVLYLVTNGRKSFYTTILERNPHKQHWRWDSTCMKSVDKAGNKLKKKFTDILETTNHICISWTRGDLLILDNYSMMHARGQASIDGRKIRRILVK